MGRRVMRTALTAVVVAETLSGCVFSYDAAHPALGYINSFDQPVTVIIEGTDPEIETPIPGQRSSDTLLSECVGTAIRVETVDGALLGRIEEQACPGWVVTITKDGNVEYRE
ncbi:hypothetical protein [Demequina muriae]|uniref:Lipoprotein n=1 Tax=Demequina muriae TaxID=3051664 RepID=A0ABT8GJK2_9MICO|nr:hypothetical protein [Demequina sp. EGI L300058]MDN4481604.1 hypothetical protein [Demequina sp. EGI L300058]